MLPRALRNLKVYLINKNFIYSEFRIAFISHLFFAHVCVFVRQSEIGAESDEIARK